MSNATPEASRRGFDLFKTGLSLGHINHRLITEGHPPVSERMFDHYRRLRRYGHEAYLPINELDVSIKARRTAS